MSDFIECSVTIQDKKYSVSQETYNQLVNLPPCPFCGFRGILEKKGNSISYWQVRCGQCRALVKGSYLEDALLGWCNRPSGMMAPLGPSVYLLPEGQTFSHLMTHWNDSIVTLLRYDENSMVEESLDIDLGRFKVCAWTKKEEE